jgi:hypothetical protein
LCCVAGKAVSVGGEVWLGMLVCRVAAIGCWCCEQGVGASALEADQAWAVNCSSEEGATSRMGHPAPAGHVLTSLSGCFTGQIRPPDRYCYCHGASRPSRAGTRWLAIVGAWALAADPCAICNYVMRSEVSEGDLASGRSTIALQ